jgi:hypothetical protein
MIALALVSLAAAVFVPGTAHASAELDRRYSLDSIGYLRAWDNADSLFVNYVADAYKEYFARQSRFTVHDLSKADVVLSNSKIPYKKLIEDKEILTQIARTSRSQTLIRTEVRKEGGEYRFQIEWLLAPTMELLGKDTLVLNDPRDGTGFSATDLRARIEKSIDNVIHAVPFSAQITGRDNNSVTLNMGFESGIEPGDTLQIGTIEGVKRHPLLNEIVEWQVTRTGKVTVDQVDEKLVFGHVTSEEVGQLVGREQKVVGVIKEPKVVPKNTAETKPETPAPDPNSPPVYGWVSGALHLGGAARDYSSQDNTIEQSNTGFLFGASGQGQAWFTRNWFADLSLGYGDITSFGGSGLTTFVLDGGYAFLLDDDVMGPKGWLKFGYRSNAYSLPDSSVNYTASVAFKSLFLGLGGDIPVRDGWGTLVDLGIGIINDVDEDSNYSGNANSITDVSLTLGGYYRYTPRITFRATLDFLWDSADFDSQRSLSQKVITFSPAIVYYF